MKQILLCLLTIFGTCASVLGDEGVPKWGVITPYEKELSSIATTPDLPAVVLFDRGNATGEYRGMTFARHVRFKVLDASALGQLANDSVVYFSYDKFSDVQAQIFHSDGSSTKIKKNQFRTQTTGDVRKFFFEFDSLRNGDIVEYQYSLDYYGGSDKLGPEVFFVFSQEKTYVEWDLRRKQTPVLLKDEDVLRRESFVNVPTWYFDHKLYCLRSELMVKLGSDIDYYYQGTNIPQDKLIPISKRIKVLTATIYKTHTWTLDSIPPIATRDTIPESQRSALHFLLFSTVGENEVVKGTFSDEHFEYVGSNIQGYLMEYVSYPRGFGNFVSSLVEKSKTDMDKISALYLFADTAFVEDSSGYVIRPKNKNLATLWKKRKGAPFEITIALVEMLKKIGLNAKPVLISTSDKSDFRSSGRFNHMIAIVELQDSIMFLDVSGDGCLPGQLNAFSRVKDGVVVDYNNSRIVPISAQQCGQ